jgi:hypothetical protein
MSTNSTPQVIVEGVIAAGVIGACILAEGVLLYHGAPSNLDGVILGRILGTLDAAVLIVLNYYFGSTRTSRSQVEAITNIGQAAANTPIHIVMPDGTHVASTTVGSAAATTAALQAVGLVHGEGATAVPDSPENVAASNASHM